MVVVIFGSNNDVKLFWSTSLLGQALERRPDVECC